MFWESAKKRVAKSPKRHLKKRRRIVFVAAIFCLGLILVFWKTIAETLRPIVFDFSLTIYRLIDKPAADAKHLVQDLKRHIYIEKNAPVLEDLLSELRSLRNKNLKLEQENQHLQGQLKLAQDVDQGSFYTSVFGQNTLNDENLLYLRAGKRQGVRKSDVLLSEGTIVGVVFDVGINYAKAHAITSFKVRIPVYFEGSKQEGILTGTNDPQQLVVRFVENPTLLHVGQKLFSSGIGGFYPKDVFLGEVSKIEGATLYVKPVIPLKTLSFVSVHHNDDSNSKLLQSADEDGIS